MNDVAAIEPVFHYPRAHPFRAAKIAGPGKKQKNPEADPIMGAGKAPVLAKKLKMANTAENNRRKLGWNQEEATNKKKLKDKVNQENKDGKTTVGGEPKQKVDQKQDADELS
ncbi:hypothetical protein scyTo_0009519 [Scyliorhinus torazame]|uniref:Uncharacterized protein n=1 Tax=Scyliorhinus torazame TaxID=75743 RepID=A0A401NNM7_SCYTO|nr:hypothetical protein [Scyliorhinus torazame]